MASFLRAFLYALATFIAALVASVLTNALRSDYSYTRDTNTTVASEDDPDAFYLDPTIVNLVVYPFLGLGALLSIIELFRATPLADQNQAEDATWKSEDEEDMLELEEIGDDNHNPSETVERIQPKKPFWTRVSQIIGRRSLVSNV